MPRCWSVDFNLVDTKLIASGSDDARVKLWSTNMSHSVASLEAKANVCCVKFNPNSCYHLAFGSADHCVHYYDLRWERLQIFLVCNQIFSPRLTIKSRVQVDQAAFERVQGSPQGGLLCQVPEQRGHRVGLHRLPAQAVERQPEPLRSLLHR